MLNDDQKRLFEKLAIYCDRYAELIPVSFVLGELATLIFRNDHDLSSLTCLFYFSRFLRHLGRVPLVGPI